MTFSERFKQLRTKYNYTQRQMADFVNLEPSTIGKWEQKNITPNDDTLFKLCEIFNCSLDYLLGREESSPKNKAVIMAKGFGKVEYELSEENLKLAHQLIAKMAEQDKNK